MKRKKPSHELPPLPEHVKKGLSHPATPPGQASSPVKGKKWYSWLFKEHSKPTEHREPASLHERFLQKQEEKRKTAPVEKPKQVTPAASPHHPATAKPSPMVAVSPGSSSPKKWYSWLFKEHTARPAPAVIPMKTTEAVKPAQKTENVLPATTAKPVPKKGFLSLFRKKRKLTEEERAKEIGERFERELIKKEKRHRLERKSLQQYLDKAGYSLSAERIKRVMFRVLIGIFIAVSAFILYKAWAWGTFTPLYSEGGSVPYAQVGGVLLFMLGLWTVIFFASFLLLQGIVYFFLDYRIYQRTRELEEVLPDFLQLASSNIAAGMPIDRALWYAIRPNFGVLAKEMEEVAKATMAGESLEASLMAFTDKYDSTLLKRSVSILLEGLRAGGEMADLLSKIALNIDELRIMKKEMAANVTTYAIFILAASVAIAPFLFALATQLLTIIVGITGSLDLAATSSILSLQAADPKVIDNFKTYSILMLLVSTLFAASIVSVIRKGNVIEGIKSIPVYAIIAIIIYHLSLIFLGGLFGGII